MKKKTIIEAVVITLVGITLAGCGAPDVQIYTAHKDPVTQEWVCEHNCAPIKPWYDGLLEAGESGLSAGADYASGGITKYIKELF